MRYCSRIYYYVALILLLFTGSANAGEKFKFYYESLSAARAAANAFTSSDCEALASRSDPDVCRGPKVYENSDYSQVKTNRSGYYHIFVYFYARGCAGHGPPDLDGKCGGDNTTPPCTAGGFEHFNSVGAPPGEKPCMLGCEYERSGGVYLGFPAKGQGTNAGDYRQTGESCTGASGMGEHDSDDPPPDRKLSGSDGPQTDYSPDEDNGQCGFVNGEHICVDVSTNSGQCVTKNGRYTCTANGDTGVAPETGENEHSVEDGRETISADTNGDGVPDHVTTVTTGTVESGAGSGPSLDEEGTPTEGETRTFCEQNPDACEQENFCEQNPEMCDLEFDPGDDPGVPTDDLDLGSAISTQGYSAPIPSSAACPQPQQVQLPQIFGGPLDIPWTPFCDFAAAIRPLILGLAYLGALIFAGRSLS